ncbi:hypothetical protein C8Q76DRAFT_790911 [Earliella scabrosa]|nr:hypothetical protein C8Q76DRAFT_790911 [Earliella scabrosa]
MSPMASQHTLPRGIVCTGYDVADAIRAYLALGFNIDLDKIRRRRVGEHLHTRLFVPTGATRDEIRAIQASIESAPPEEDVRFI